MKTIPIRFSNCVAIIDDDDFEECSKYPWRKDRRGYVVFSKGSAWSKTYTTVSLHSFVNKTPKGKKTDHINGNKLDNRRSNLRTCTIAENLRNSKGKNVLKTSKFKGVHLSKQSHKWQAHIGFNMKSIYIGGFDSEIEAAKAYNDKALSCFGEFARLNPI